MTITHKLSIDLTRREFPARVDAVQDDCGRALALMLHTNGIPWTIPDTVGALIRYCKADGIGGEYDFLPDGTCAWSIDGNTLTVVLAPQVLTAAGDVTLSVVLKDGQSYISTFDIMLHVQSNLKTRIAGADAYFNIAAAENALAEIGIKIMKEEISSIVLMGDSITDGIGGPGYNGSCTDDPSTNTEGYCWANVFKKFVESRYDISVTNLGMSGSCMLRQKEQALPLLTKEDFVIWLVGTNDRDTRLSYASNLRSAIAAIKEAGAGVLVIGSIPSTLEDEQAHTVNMQEMDELTACIASGFVPHFSMYQEFIRYCDVHGIALEDCFADHVHPNETGYHIMFRILCAKLGLPLDPYTDYGFYSSWWTGSGSSSGDSDGCSCSGTEVVLTTDTDTRSESLCESGIPPSSAIVPCSVMTDYDSDAATTVLSGRHLTRAVLNVHTAGTITFGTVDLTKAGQEKAAYLTSVELTAEETGMVEFPLHMDIGENETLAVQSTTDTGKLGFFVSYGTDPDDDLRVWKPVAFAGTEADAGIHIYGTIFGI